MEKTLATILVILSLVVGLVCGAVFAPSNEVIKIQTIEVPGEPITETETIEVKVFDTSLVLDTAYKDFLNAADDDDDLVCDGDEYGLDEVSLIKRYDDYSLDFDEDEYTVSFKVKLKFDEDGEKSCKETFDVEVFYEEDEDPEVSY